jgi:hypothetical protein
MDRGSIYNGYGVQYTMGRGSKYHGYGGQNTIDRGFDIPWILLFKKIMI